MTKPTFAFERLVQRTRLGAAAIAGLVLLAAGNAGARDADAAFRFGDYRSTLAPLDDPSHVAVTAGGGIVVAETGAGRVRVLTPDGAVQRVIGEDLLVRPTGVALGEDGTLYVTDAGRHRVEVFDVTGAHVRGWGGLGDEPGRFNAPAGLTVAGNKVYVADLGNHRVQVFDVEGGHERSIGGFGAEAGQFNRPEAVAVDEDGFIYVADTDNNRIQRFDAAGAPVAAWGDWGPFQGLMDQPSDLAWTGGRLYVADTLNHRLQAFDAEGNALEQWGAHALFPREGEGRLHYPRSIAVAPSGAFGVVAESFENRVQVFDRLPAGVEPPPPLPPPSKQSQSHFGPRLATDGNLLLLAEPELHRVHVFELSKEIPILIGSVGERGLRFGQMVRLAGLEIGYDARRFFVSDVATRRLQVFRLDYDPAGPRGFSPRRARFARAHDLRSLTVEASADPPRWVIEPDAIERDAAGNLYVVDGRNSMIHVFDAELAFLRSWGGYGTEPGRFRRPTDLAIDPTGATVYVVDADNHRVQAFAPDGTPLRAWGRRGDDDGAFLEPFGVTVGRQGFVYVTDAARGRVQKFTPAGELEAAWGRTGGEHGEFWKPGGIVQDERGRIIVADPGNHRAQIFTSEGEWLVTFGVGRAYTRKQLQRRTGDE